MGSGRYTQASTFVTQWAAKYGSRLHRFLVTRLRAGDVAGDLAQEVWLRLLQRQSQEAIEEPLAYLFSVARQVAYHHRARAAKQPLAADHDTLDQLAGRLQTSFTDEMAEELHHEREWEKWMGILQEAHQKVLELKYRGGLTNKQIAELLNTSEWTVKRYVVEAAAAIKEHRARGR